ncbi:MAG: trigger factor [Sulfurospirillaceae bacterium]|nr:trigger factor [Sulfurospirillaceae bacterium]
MQINAKRINSANAQIDAKIPNVLLNSKEDKIAAKAAKNMKVDGFRQGKVPTHVVKARHGEQIRQDAEQEALKELFDNALIELDVKADMVVGEPIISKFEKTDDGIEVEVKVSFRPVVELDNYQDAIPDYKTPRVTQKEIDQRIQEMMGATAGMKKVEEDRALANGDFAQIDFEGFVDGVPFEGGKAEKYLLEIGSGSFIPGFEEGLIGLKAGEEKDVEVTFPKEYNNKDLAGKLSVFKVKLHEIQAKDVKETPDADDLKKLMPGEENPTKEALEAQVKEQLKNEKLHKLFSEEVRPKFIDAILEKTQFDIPENIVDQEIDLQVRNIFGSMSEEEIKEYSENPAKIEEKRSEYADEARNSVKLTFIVDELAKIEEISVSDQEVTQMIYFEAMQQGQDPKQYFEYYQKQGLLPAVKMAIVEDRLFTQIFTKNKKTTPQTEAK